MTTRRDFLRLALGATAVPFLPAFPAPARAGVPFTIAVHDEIAVPMGAFRQAPL